MARKPINRAVQKSRSAPGVPVSGGNTPDGNAGIIDPVIGTDTGEVGTVIGGDEHAERNGFDEYTPGDTTGNTGGDSHGNGDRNTVGINSGRRGRPVGSKNGTRKALSQDLESVEALLMSTHLMLAAMLDSADFALEPDEAKKLAESLDRVKRLYPMNFNPKIMAWMHLATTAGGIYGPRVFLLLAAKKPKPGPKLVPMPEQAPKQEPQKQTVNAAPIYTPSDLNNTPPVENYGE